VSLIITFIVSYLLIGDFALAGKAYTNLWWQLSLIITLGTLAGAIIPEVVKVFTSTNSKHVREVVTASKAGGASLNILSGIVAGYFSAFWIGVIIVALMAGAYIVSQFDLTAVINPDAAKAAMMAAVFSFGLVAFGFLGMGPVTIAVDSYGPVTDNAQSVYELSTIEQIPGIKEEVKRDFGFDLNFRIAKFLLEENDGAGNTFKATAKPVLIGTAVVGADHHGLLHRHAAHRGPHGEPGQAVAAAPAFPARPGRRRRNDFLVLRRQHAGRIDRRLPRGGVHQHAHPLDEVVKASQRDSKKVVEICTIYAQKGMFNIFMAVFFGTLACAFIEPFFFIGYLISLAIIGLYQAVFMANAGGAWDNAKKIVETEMHAKGTDLHNAAVVGDTVGDPFKDTASVAMNPIIKFTTLFGLLAVEMAVGLQAQGYQAVVLLLAAAFLAVNLVFVFRSFYGMRIFAKNEE
jgi:K(+)-stimulated pyrophosphate-energized sodium pump